MAQLHAFKGLRPKQEIASQVAELPYDVVNTEEARTIARGNELSFFHISRPEIGLPDSTNPYDELVYATGRKNLDDFITKGILRQDDQPCLYLYTLIMEGRVQHGLIACCNIDDYLNNIIKKHELTRADKEKDRTRHLDTLGANTGPVYLMYREDGAKKDLFNTALKLQPEYDFVAPDGVAHILRVIRDRELIEQFKAAFAGDVLYIADGHHRAASAVAVGKLRRSRTPGYTGSEEFNWFLGVIFPHDQLNILPYNRLVRDLHGQTPEAFLANVEKCFSVKKNGGKNPATSRLFSMYIGGHWYTLDPKMHIHEDPVEGLDVSILQRYLLSPILGIKDPRTDKRIEFVGGIRGTAELEKKVDSGEFAVAFSLYPTTVTQLMEVSNKDGIMPPKSTWFEPKLRSGLVLHTID